MTICNYCIICYLCICDLVTCYICVYILLGRVSLKQYIPSKKSKYGIKCWLISDSRTGYVNTIDVYTGAKNNYTYNTKGEGYEVVMNLCKPFSNSNRIIYFDNYFTSIDLLRDLAKINLFAVGTVRKDRKGLPQVYIYLLH